MVFNEAIISSAVVLFLVMDPLGNIPIFLSILKDIKPKKKMENNFKGIINCIGYLTDILILRATDT